MGIYRAWRNGWLNNRNAGDLGRHPGHYDITVKFRQFIEGCVCKKVEDEFHFIMERECNSELRHGLFNRMCNQYC